MGHPGPSDEAAANDPGLLYITRQVEFADIHDDPRWQEFRERTGTSEAQLAAIEFEVQRPQ